MQRALLTHRVRTRCFAFQRRRSTRVK